MASEEFNENQREYYRIRRLAFPEHFRELDFRKRQNQNAVLRKLRFLRYNSSIKGKLCRKRYSKTDKGRRAQRRYVIKHSLKAYAHHVKHRALKRGATISGYQKQIEEIYSRARQLRRWFRVEVDHIIALSTGGKHHPANLRIIYKSENASKGNCVDYKPSFIFS